MTNNNFKQLLLKNMKKIKIKLFNQILRTVITFLMVISLSFTLISCSDRIEAVTPFEKDFQPLAKQEGKLKEVSPPVVITELNKSLQKYQPQVKIISPKIDQNFDETSIKVQLKVEDYPLFKNEEKQMGNHLHLILDNEPYRSIYNLDQPIILENLTPGTHTLRVFPVKPWHESFKNNGAYAQTTFHILTKSEDNNPDPNLPLLTYSRPTGTYGAEPIMLDFYLTNTPLHLVAQENPQDQVTDWRIKVTINGQTFLLDSWQPIYLTGFNKGNNWVKLEYIDESGNEVKNVFNNTVRLINYQPNGQDTLSQMLRGDVTLEQVKDIVDPSYIAPVIQPEIEVKEEIKPVEVQPETQVKIEEKLEENIIEDQPIETTEKLEIEENQLEETDKIEPKLEINDVEINETKLQEKEENIETIETEEKPINEPITIDQITQPSVKIDNETSIPEMKNTETTENQKQPNFLNSVTNFWNSLLEKTN